SLGGGELLAKVLVLMVQPLQFRLDLVEELVDLPHVVTLPQADGREALVAHVLGCQRHDLTSGLAGRLDIGTPYPVSGLGAEGAWQFFGPTPARHKINTPFPGRPQTGKRFLTRNCRIQMITTSTRNERSRAIPPKRNGGITLRNAFRGGSVTV